MDGPFRGPAFATQSRKYASFGAVPAHAGVAINAAISVTANIKLGETQALGADQKAVSVGPMY
jgi:hypothetical protein